MIGSVAVNKHTKKRVDSYVTSKGLYNFFTVCYSGRLSEYNRKVISVRERIEVHIPLLFCHYFYAVPIFMRN